MNMWMRRTFGCANPDSRLGEYKNNQAVHYDKSQIGQYGVDLEKSLKDKQVKGIYTIVTISSWASGHCDLLRNNATCLGKCHFSDLVDFIFYCDVWNLD